jgi:folate-dependent tRNA-U54 methylase TrmFO/GidA
MVGFQTKLKHGAQAEVFRMIPGLANAQFARLGGLHRNTFINSPRLLDRSLRMKVAPRLRFAGQMTGVEGYVESAATGLLAGRFAAAERLGKTLDAPPPTTALGALVDHVTGGHIEGAEVGKTVPADEHQLRPAAADGDPQGRRRRRQDPAEGTRPRQEAADEHPGAGGPGRLGGE